MTRTASKETVGECIICEGMGTEIAYTEHKGTAIPLFGRHGTTCTHCHGSGLRPQKVVCPICYGKGGGKAMRCIHCRGNGYNLMRLTPGQQFESQGLLP